MTLNVRRKRRLTLLLDERFVLDTINRSSVKDNNKSQQSVFLQSRNLIRWKENVQLKKRSV